jgi:hypothetical protein
VKNSFEKTATSNKRSQALKSILEKQNGVDAADDKSLVPDHTNYPRGSDC